MILSQEITRFVIQLITVAGAGIGVRKAYLFAPLTQAVGMSGAYWALWGGLV